jgi:putative IMPACT (imprinted ancient) family translation regulator
LFITSAFYSKIYLQFNEKAVDHMTEEKKEPELEAKAGEHTHEHEIPKSALINKQTPWEHFKQTKQFKKSAHGFAAQHLNRRTGGKGG